MWYDFSEKKIYSFRSHSLIGDSMYPNQLLLNQFDLQWFANPEDEGRTEKPTERRIRKAREEGKVPKSADLTASIVLLFSIIALALFGKYLLIQIGQLMIDFFKTAPANSFFDQPNWMSVFAFQFLKIIFPIFGIALTMAILGNVVQFGFLFSTKPITPDLKKIIPRFGQYFKKSFASVEALYNLAKSIGKVLLVALICFLNVSSKINKVDYTIHLSLWESFNFYASLIFSIMIESALLFLLLSIPDFLFQRKQHLDSLKMTKYDLKQEFKESEGDPLIKNRLRERMNQILKSSQLKSVPDADVVITNPTHYAVAIKYDREKAPAPYVVAKGEDGVALHIRRIAKESNVHLVENKQLARSLYDELDVGDVIPEHYYEIMVTILTEVYRMNGVMEAAV